jgi:FkbH-like protein
MSDPPGLDWLPVTEHWRERAAALSAGTAGWDAAIALANTRLDFVRTNALDALIRRRFAGPPPEWTSRPVRLALLGSATLTHLHAAVRVAGLRRGLWIDTYETGYGQYLQELLQPGSGLHAFAPTAVLFAFDAAHLTRGLDVGMDVDTSDQALDATLAGMRQAWELARAAFECPILQQTVLNVCPAVLGSNEDRLPGSPHRAVGRINAWLRGHGQAIAKDAADGNTATINTVDVDLIAVDDRAAADGLGAWHDPALWHRSKQEISPAAAPVWGDLVARVLAARQGRSYKALVLDLDDTLWGGVVGEAGVEGIVLGQGSPLGEGFLAVQNYVRNLSRRGIILGVASKNDAANALAPFDHHPEMLLRRADIAAFRADWNDKAGNLEAIAQELNIGLDSLVFLDDNPFERALVRAALPMVAVPEVPDDPALVPAALAAAGYFEAVSVTAEDRERTQAYQGNRQRAALAAATTNLAEYLRSLDMRLKWRRFDPTGLQRTLQLINKTNQFNLRTRRYTEAELVAVMNDPAAVGLQLRLLDRFGDNGIIAVVIGRLQPPGDALHIDTWLMSCRVLGRGVEASTLEVLAAQARRLGAQRLVGEYIPTPKNGMVKDLYEGLGFALVSRDADGRSTAELELPRFSPRYAYMSANACIAIDEDT